MRTSPLFILMTLIFQHCSVLDASTRRYNRELKNQDIPQSIIGATWTLHAAGNDEKLCDITLQFQAKGKLVMTFRNHIFEGNYLMAKENRFKQLFVGFHPKVVWTGDRECQYNPSIFALYMNGKDIPFLVSDSTITIERMDKVLYFNSSHKK